MTDFSKTASRRQLLKAVSSVVVLAPLGALVGCSGEQEPAAPPKPPAPQPAAAKPAAPAAPAAATAPPPEPATPASPATANLPLLEETNPQAQALGYVSDAANADAAKFPQFAAGKQCANCSLYQGGAGSEQGPCSLFPGKQVKAAGWCSAHSPKAVASVLRQ